MAAKVTARDDAVARWLRDRGCSDQVVAGGLEGLLARWEAFVDSVDGYPFALDDYLNDLDARDLLGGALVVAPVAEAEAARERLAVADARMRAQVVPAGGCLWGEAVAEDEGWTPVTHWWYFTRPRRPGDQLAEDLGSRQ